MVLRKEFWLMKLLKRQTTPDMEQNLTVSSRKKAGREMLTLLATFVRQNGMSKGYEVYQFVEYHNHLMVADEHKHFMTANRSLDPIHRRFMEDCGRCNIGPTLTFKLLKEIMGGPENESSDAFYYEIEIGSHGNLTKLFWADAISRRNYHMFGDVISFDSTYNTNRYCMSFAPFTGKYNHSRAVTFGAGLLSSEEPDEFDIIWNDMMERYGLEDVHWTTSMSESENCFLKNYTKPRANLVQFINFFNYAVGDQRNANSRLNYLDYSTIPYMSTQLPIEKHASTIYTDSIFKHVQQEISMVCEIVSITVEDNIKMHMVKDQYGRTWDVKYDCKQDTFDCSCKKFSGIDLDEKQEVKKKLFSNFYQLVQKSEGSMDHLSLLCAGLDDLEEHIFGNCAIPSVIEKKKMVEEFYGMAVPDVIDVHPPDVVRTKGSTSDKVSKRESAIRKANKPLRRCGKCHKMGRHDSRNCGRFNEKAD
ncbi:uncharacterized protein LOC121808827 [Salvia splendens]|uniref:uncharacterized protein LOC121808827 n=1 Tax=Salvia splendens TaxID=180675 RepID=UPI001C27252D|nr:uncharacterized protein LOC121808827 [Salvia splendens]